MNTSVDENNPVAIIDVDSVVARHKGRSTNLVVYFDEGQIGARRSIAGLIAAVKVLASLCHQHFKNISGVNG